ncbi:hypothetical protein [Chryseobacterium cheonjiense]|uniref:Uncharacterized protein n=1 Tax=Chryseobacterium cheonjiense TaxID=2728845 RepID=A0A7Y0A8V3_9FLAO|nr:hypothetical protein [Chryseobacterium cheonjiense]NML58847.1 hypothetical protein [Chryseobacterium cheonjiense]
MQETNGGLQKSPTTCGNLRRSTEVSRNLRETFGGVRKSRATLRETNCNCRKSPATCRKQNAVAGSYKQVCL